jgi:thiamine biosynthesis lipoprotein
LNDKSKTIQFDRAGVELDLGGIAKGYAVDCVVGLLKKHGIERALVSAGGSTIFGLGSPPNSAGWEVKIQDPLDPGKIAETVLLFNRALSVAGSSEKFFEIDGRRYSHIMDPRIGKPVRDVLSVAVIAGSGTAGDALDNHLCVEGVERSREYLSRNSGIEVLFFLPASAKQWNLIRLKSGSLDHR